MKYNSEMFFLLLFEYLWVCKVKYILNRTRKTDSQGQKENQSEELEVIYYIIH